MTADRVLVSTQADSRQNLLDHLYRKWDRIQGLELIQDIPAWEALGKAFGSVVKVVFRALNRRWFERHLNGRKLHWFGKHVAEVTEQQHEDFLTHALRIVPGSQCCDSSLRRRILLDALLRDLDHLTRRGNFFPRHRRRQWTPVLTLDCTPENTPGLEVVQSLVELYQREPTSPKVAIQLVPLWLVSLM